MHKNKYCSKKLVVLGNIQQHESQLHIWQDDWY